MPKEKVHACPSEQLSVHQEEREAGQSCGLSSVKANYFMRGSVRKGSSVKIERKILNLNHIYANI